MEFKGRKGREYIVIDEGKYAGETALVLKKIERQLIIYKYLVSGRILEKSDIMGSDGEGASSLYNIPPSTIYKDMQDLTDAGLINLRYNPVERWYEQSYEEHDYDEENDSPNRRAHIRKLKRLAWCLRWLRNDPPGLDYDDDGNIVAVIEGEKSCKDYYLEQFPRESQRTMNRDFELLNNIGYVVRYNKKLGRYDFYEDDCCFWEDWPWVPGVIYTKKYGLCHMIGEGYEMDIQENLYYETIGLRKGLPEEEWGEE